MVLDNALFLLDMINASTDKQFHGTRKHNSGITSLVPLPKSFSSFEALGFPEVAHITEKDPDSDEIIISPNQFNFLETDDLALEERLALEDMISYTVNIQSCV